MSDALSFEKVWELFQETAQQMKETDRRMKETDRRMQETDRIVQENAQILRETDRIVQENARQMKETDRQMKETDRRMQETDRQMKELSRQMGGLNNSFGELAEHLVAPGIKEKFNALNFHFDKCGKNVKIYGPDNRVIAEIDLFLENGDTAIAVEVKARLLKQDVDQHLERMETLRRRADKHNDKRKFHGAAAGAIMEPQVKKYALAAGLFVIEQSGDTVKIDIPEGFTPRAW